VATDTLTLIVYPPLDFNGDGYIDEEDLWKLLEVIWPKDFDQVEADAQKLRIIKAVLEESDVNGDGRIAYVEFESMVLRSETFLQYFTIDF